MNTRRNFLKCSALLAGGSAFSPARNLFAQDRGNKQPVRFIFMTKSSGLRPHELALPSFSSADKKKDEQKDSVSADLSKHDLPKWMSVLDNHKKDMAIVQGLSAKGIACGHSGNQACLGMFKTGDSRVLGNVKWATADVELGRLYPSPFEHIEVQTVGNKRGIVAGQAATGKMAYNYAYADPQTAYKELFKTAFSDVNTKNEIEADAAVMDYLNDLTTNNYNHLQGIEHLKMTNYRHTVQTIKKRDFLLKDMSARIFKHLPKLDKEYFSDTATTVKRQKAFAQILISAFKAGLTNSALFTLDTLATRYDGIPQLAEGSSLHLHDLGHGKKYAGKSNEVVRGYIRIHHMNLINTMVEAFKKTPEGNGTMFDNTVIMYQSENGETHHSNGSEQPIVMLAGKNTKMNFIGNYVRLPGYGQQGHKTLGNWYTTHLNNHGNPIKHYGQFDLELNKFGLDQSGPIKEFLV